MPQPPASDTNPLSSIDLERLRPRLHRYCARMLGSSLDGEDVVQEALLRALQSAPPDQPIDNPEGWLFRIAHNVALDALRRRARTEGTHSEDDVDLLVHPVDEQARREAAAASLPTFMRIPASQRSVVILFDVLEYSAEEVGEIVGTSVPAVKSVLQRGRSRLRTLATESPAAHRNALSNAEQQLLRRYVDLFNARDFDTLRTMLAADVKLDLVNRLTLEGAAVGQYFARYAQTHGWHARPAIVEGRPGFLVQQRDGPDQQPDYFVLLGWDGERVSTIRDFLFARYAQEGAEWSALG